MNEKQIRILGTIGSIMAVGMYVAYIPQIQANLAGREVGFMELLQPLVACINCTIWVAYGLFKQPRDWPIAVANAPGIVLGLVTFITGL
ncbi:SemiSWEET family transporter [Neisseria sp. 23W00296]|uniref:SemiSWEET family transporter n=1 Tax=unclassified Neisseria TaxID=2623750 RepID=UPI0037573330